MILLETPDNAGIYVIENLANGNFYIGQASCIRRRFKEHSSLLARGKHDNLHLQRAYLKYGSEVFVMFMMQPCQDVELDKVEQEWVDVFWDDCKTCYNIKVVANKPPNRKGAKLTPEQLQKWSEVKKGKRLTEEHKQKIGKTKIGKKRQFTESWKANIAKTHAKTFDVQLLSPTGEVYGPITNLKAFAKKYGLHAQGLGALIRGKLSQTKGWKLLTTTNSWLQ